MMPLLAETTYRVFGDLVTPGVSLLWFLGAFGLWLGIRLIKDRLDRSRIADYVEQGGGSVVRIAWNPLGRGWFGERGDRIYEVTYRTRKGKTVTATCKTSMFSGVYWTGGPAPSVEPPPESIQCLSCGTSIPESRERCPKCGWSYEQRETKRHDA
ncbi:MAG: zinc ribbon domain-containing protein [Verrucomicrobia bacterium]|nr:zinc ribbon domain-containing protein [Verrucomicrobiota bacterium]